ncbi:MAG: hypothetical protein NW203_09855 [Hyphomonadaceae bacterium]|nr:hypothetical protein [Hyphomonadaceae bacterium]
MSQPEGSQTPNPERRSDAAILCLLIGAAMIGLAWLLGVGGVMALALSGGVDGAAAGGLASLIILPLTAVAGFILCVIGGVWLFVQVVADSREHAGRERYGRDVER